MSPQENRNHATNAVPAQDVSAGSLKSASSLSQPSPDTTVQLSRLEEILDRIIATLAPLVGP